MGIQAWFILIGVSAMTLIVWDGRHRKAKLLTSAAAASSSAETSHQTPLANTSSTSREIAASGVMAAPEVTVKDTQPQADLTAVVVPLKEGSRIGVATHISGNITANESVLIKGSVQGTVVASHHPITVASTGHVASYIEGGCIDVDGHVTGALKANTKLTLLSRARIHGVIEAPSLECAAGAWLQTNVKHIASQQSIAMVS